MWKLYYGKDRENYERIIIAQNADDASNFACSSKWIDRYPACIGIADKHDIELKCEGLVASVLMVTEDDNKEGMYAVKKYESWIETRGKCPNRSCKTCRYGTLSMYREPCRYCSCSNNEWLPEDADIKEEEKEELEHNCDTCKYKDLSIVSSECRPCKSTSDGKSMTNWTPAVEEKKEKPLSEYSVEELEAELKKRKDEEQRAESKKWIESFIMGDYYKVYLKDKPERFVIVRAERFVTNDDDNTGVYCVNVYDHNMAWVKYPTIGEHFKTTTRYTVEHIVNGYKRNVM